MVQVSKEKLVNESEGVNNEKINSEFGFEDDPFEKSRLKGTKFWIIKHILHKRNKWLLFLYLTLSILVSVMGSLGVVVIGYAIEDFIIPSGTGSNVLYWTLIYLFLAVGSPIIGVGQRVSRIILAQRLELEVRREFYKSLIGKSQSFHDKQAIGDLMARATDDVRFLNLLINPGISNLFFALNSLVVPIVMIIIMFPSQFFQLLIFPLIYTILFVFSLKKYVTKLEPLFIERRVVFGMMNAILNESMDGIEVIKSMAQEKQSIEKYRTSAIKHRDLAIKLGKIQARYYPLLYVAILITLGLAHSIFLNYYGFLTIAEVIIYLGLLSRLRTSTESSLYAFFYIKAASIGANRLLEKMLAKSEIGEASKAIAKEIKGKLEFENVSFNYPGTSNNVLKNISFKVESGQTVAIVGTTGSGKTTLTKLLSRLYDINKGQILIDGQNIQNYSLKSLRDQIAYIEQDVFLFSRTVYENIAFSRENTSREDIISCAKKAQAHEFISALPKQYNTEVGERGVQLSGGERQRIAIARAFLSNPKLLILDDASSAIDAKTEEKIQSAISRILHKRTTLLITHRLSQIRWADLILVLKRGEIVAKGSHKELLKNSEEYRKIFVKKFDKTYSELVEEES